MPFKSNARNTSKLSLIEDRGQTDRVLIDLDLQFKSPESHGNDPHTRAKDQSVQRTE